MSRAIKDKMDKLDTLSGGIVFGKEEAWERLQGKLEKKAVRKIAIPYKLAAAAAVLLLTVYISILYNKTEDKIAAAPALYQYEATETTQSMRAVKDSTAGIVSDDAEEVRSANQNSHAVAKTPPTTSAPLPDTALVVEAPEMTKSDVQTPAPATAIAPAAKQGIRIVHINEIDNDEPQRPSYASAKTTTKEMKVVTAQEEWDDESAAVIQRNNRPHGTSPFFTLPGKNTPSANNNMPVASNPFSIKLSIQN